MDRKARTGVVVAITALLGATLVVSSASAQDADVGQASVIELRNGGGGDPGLDRTERIGKGGPTLLKHTLVDVDDQPAGTVVWYCAWGEVATVCETFLELLPGATTSEGSIVAEGLFEGFNGEALAITGGTGAYASARGDVTLSVVDDEFTWRLSITS